MTNQGLRIELGMSSSDEGLYEFADIRCFRLSAPTVLV